MEKYLKPVEKFYAKDPKKYHTYWHIFNLFELYNLHKDEFHKEFPNLNENILFESIAWHDCVYIPGCDLNEYLSAQAYYYTMRKKPDFRDCVEVDFPVYSIILSTKIGNEEFDTPEKMVMHDLDWSGFCNYYHKMLDNEEKILYEATYDGRYFVKEVRNNQLNFYKSIVNKDLYVTETFKNLLCNETAKKNLEKRIKEMQNKEKEINIKC